MVLLKLLQIKDGKFIITNYLKYDLTSITRPYEYLTKQTFLSS